MWTSHRVQAAGGRRDPCWGSAVAASHRSNLRVDLSSHAYERASLGVPLAQHKLGM